MKLTMQPDHLGILSCEAYFFLTPWCSSVGFPNLKTCLFWWWHWSSSTQTCLQVGKTHGPAKSPSETLSNGLSNGYNRQGYFFQQGLRTIMQTLHLETAWFVSWYRYNCLLSFEDPVLKHSWRPAKSPSETLRNGLSNGYNRQRYLFQ